MSDHWLTYVASFLIVVGVLMIGVAVQEYTEWRKDRR